MSRPPSSHLTPAGRQDAVSKKGAVTMLFKECPNCHYRWLDRETFLADPLLSLIGYQANFGDLVAGYFLFTHDTAECGTSLAVEARYFTDMHKGPVFQSCPIQPTDCPGYCHKINSLEACSYKCECAYVRDVLQIVRNWPKQVKERFL